MKIKKIFSLFVCIAVTAGMLLGVNAYAEGETELPWKYSRAVHDFSAFKNKPTGWGAGGASSLFKTAQNLDSTGGNLKVTYPKISGNEMTWELKLGTESVLKETDGAVSLDIDASALTYSPKLQFQLRQEGGSYYRTAVETEVYFVSESGEITTVKTAKYGSKGAYVSVPAGFKGTAVFALGDYTDTNAADGSSVYGITNMTVRLLAIDINEESVITYDNIKYLTNTNPDGEGGSGEQGGSENPDDNGKVTLPWKYSKIKADFSPSTAKPSCWGTSSANKPTLAVENEKLNVKYTAVTGNEMTWELKLGEKGKPENTDGGIGIDIDTSSLNYGVKFQWRLRDEVNAKYKRVPAGSAVYLIAADNTVTAVKTVTHDNPSKGAYVEIPGGFKGTVVFPFADFTEGDSDKTVYEFEKVTLRALIIDTKSESTIVYDNIAYYTNVKPEDPGAKVYPWGGVRVVMNLTGFEEEIAKDGNKSKFGVWGGDPTKLKRSDCTMENGRLKVTYPKGTDFAFSFRPENPVDGDLGAAIKVDASKLNYAHRMRILVSDEGIGYLQPGEGTMYYLIDESGKITEVPADGSSSVTIPAGFKGTVGVEFASLTKGDTSKVSIAEISKWPALRFQLRVMDIKNDGDVIYYDDIGYLSKNASPSTGEDATVLYIAYAVLAASVLCGALGVINPKKIFKK